MRIVKETLLSIAAAGLTAAIAVAADDALTGSLRRENARGTVAEKSAPTATPLAATIDGILKQGCADKKTPCTPYFYIALPRQLGELRTGRPALTDAQCRELGQPLDCARGVQLEMKGNTAAELTPLVGARLSVSGSLMDDHSSAHVLPAVMRVETLHVAGDAPR